MHNIKSRNISDDQIHRVEFSVYMYIRPFTGLCTKTTKHILEFIGLIYKLIGCKFLHSQMLNQT